MIVAPLAGITYSTTSQWIARFDIQCHMPHKKSDEGMIVTCLVAPIVGQSVFRMVEELDIEPGYRHMIQ
jgi:hypothetical protein